MRLGLPDKPENYEQQQLNGLTCYYPESLAAEFRRIRIGIETFLFIKTLVASGER